MKMNMIKLLALILASLLLLIQVLVLSGCSQTNFLRDRSQDYKTAREYPCLQIPKGMSKETCSDTYAIPNE